MITYWMCYCILLLSVHTSRTSNSFNDEDRFCPEKCSCNINESITVTCRRLILSRVPTSTAVMSANVMDLSLNTIEVVKSDFFEGCNNLSILYMSESEIEKIDVSAFRSLKNLENIDLSKNELAYIPHDLFINNPKLKCLFLSSNKLTMLKNYGPILTSSSLLHLHMDSCMISELSNTSLSKLPNLQSLDLSRNGLKVLSVDTLLPLGNLTDINLSKNPWTCNDDFEKLACLVYHTSKPHSHKMTCYMKKGRAKSYELYDQYELCGKLPSVKRFRSTPFQDTSQENATGGLQEYTRKRANENDEASTISNSKQPPRPHDNKGPENSEEGAGGTQITVFDKRGVETEVTGEAELGTTPKSETGGCRCVETEVTGEAELGTTPKSETGGCFSQLSWYCTAVFVITTALVAYVLAFFIRLFVKKICYRHQHKKQGNDDAGELLPTSRPDEATGTEAENAAL